MLYFLDDTEMDQLGDAPIYTVIAIPRQPRLLAPPQEDRLSAGPVPVFLAASLLLERKDYRMPGAVEVTDHRALTGTPVFHSTLRIGAVAR